MLTIHGVPISVHTRKVLVTAIEKQLQFRNEPVIPFTPPAGWSDLSPTRKIPVITDGDFVLRNSAVICAYLERVHPSPALYPADARAYAEALWFEEYAGGTIFREVIHGLFVQKIIRPKILKQETDPTVIETILERRAATGVRLPGKLDRRRLHCRRAIHHRRSSRSCRTSSTSTISATRSTSGTQNCAAISPGTSSGRRSGRRCWRRNPSWRPWDSTVRSCARPLQLPHENVPLPLAGRG